MGGPSVALSNPPADGETVAKAPRTSLTQPLTTAVEIPVVSEDLKADQRAEAGRKGLV